jgi:hypothetical protein
MKTSNIYGVYAVGLIHNSIPFSSGTRAPNSRVCRNIRGDCNQEERIPDDQIFNDQVSLDNSSNR